MTAPDWSVPPWARPGPEHRAPLPAQADVVIVGGGIVGVSAGWELARQGLRVVLCEKGRIAAEQSGRNWGWIRAQGRDPAELPLMIEARRIWTGWADRLGPGLGYTLAGVTYLANDARDLAGFADWLSHARAHVLDTRLLGAAEMQAMFPGLNPGHWAGALHTASDARPSRSRRCRSSPGRRRPRGWRSARAARCAGSTWPAGVSPGW